MKNIHIVRFLDGNRLLLTSLIFADFISILKKREKNLNVSFQIAFFSHGWLMDGECSIPRVFANLKNT